MFFFHVIVHLVLLCLAAQTQRARAEDNLLIKWEDLSQAACDANPSDWGNLSGDFSPASGFRRQTSTSKPAYMRGVPHSIWYKLPQPVIVGKFSFRNRVDGKGTSNNPVDIELIGSKDCNNWIDIFSVNGLTWSKPDEQKEFRVENPVKHKIMRDNAFSCYGIKIRKSTSSGPCLQDIKMWRLDESEAVTEKPIVVTEDPTPATEKPIVVTEDPTPATEKPIVVTEDPKPVTEEPNTVAKDLKSMVEVLTKLSNTVNKNTEHFQQLRKRIEKLPGTV